MEPMIILLVSFVLTCAAIIIVLLGKRELARASREQQPNQSRYDLRKGMEAIVEIEMQRSEARQRRAEEQERARATRSRNAENLARFRAKRRK